MGSDLPQIVAIDVGWRLVIDCFQKHDMVLGLDTLCARVGSCKYKVISDIRFMGKLEVLQNKRRFLFKSVKKKTDKQASKTMKSTEVARKLKVYHNLTQ